MPKPTSQTVKKPAPTRTLALCLAGAGFVVMAGGLGCVNTRNELNKKLSNATSNLSSGSGTPSDHHAIGNVTITTDGSANSPKYVTTIYFDPSHSTAADGGPTAPLISSHCSVGNSSGSNAKPCFCEFSWSETNTSSGTNQPFTRKVQTALTKVQQQLVACEAPSAYATEIDNGLKIKITVVPASGNSELFTVSTFSYLKNTLSNVGSFQDAQGHAFDNIVHYSCYEQFKIGTVIQSRLGTGTNSGTGETVKYPLANKFCVQTANAPGGSPECPNLPSNLSNSAQAYYYNFFIRASQSGATNQWNDRYTCPSIKEPIYNAGGVGTQGKLYPMDTHFALAMAPNNGFNIGVDAFVELANGGSDPISQSAQKCDGSVPAGNASTSGFVQACLGYAAKPNADGTCPYIRDSSGQIRFTYRLRRFVALYPPLFNIDGSAPDTPQRTDTIYVLDRPVTPPTGSDPLKPYTMRGPKPCPFALFDSKGVLGYADAAYVNTGGKLPVYGATSNPGWNGTNVDGIKLPSFDSVNSCSAAIPLVKSSVTNPDLTVLSLGTVNQFNPVLQSVYVRPIRAWAPHYEEDTSFLACAPQASPLRDPPLHFAKDPTTGNVNWCAEVYPSQNDRVPALDSTFNPSAPLSTGNPYVGHVRPYTSHVAKNSASGDCTATIPATTPSVPLYPAASTGTCDPLASPQGLARHPANAFVDTKNTSPNATPVLENKCANNTCDRTAIVTGGLGWQQFPLLATAPQVEQAISSDTTYGCVLTYDGGGPKTGKTTPTQGCCGANVKLATGITVPTPYDTKPQAVNTAAHLEPDAPCLIPKY